MTPHLSTDAPAAARPAARRHWSLDDIPWHAIRHDALAQSQAFFYLVASASLMESATGLYTENLIDFFPLVGDVGVNEAVFFDAAKQFIGRRRLTLGDRLTNDAEAVIMGNPAMVRRKKSEKRRKKFEARLGPGAYLPKEEREKLNAALEEAAKAEVAR